MFLPVTVEADIDPQRRPAIVTLSLITVNSLIHVYLFLHQSESYRYNYYFLYGIVRFDYSWWAAFTCTLLHGSWMHLIGNMYFLWIYGCTLERLIGSLNFFLLYLIGAFVSSNIHVLTVFELYIDEPAIGASGAISAVLGAFLVLLPTAKFRTLYFDMLSFRPIMVELPAFVVLGLWFLGQLMYTLQLLGPINGIAFWAHVAGFVGGAGCGTLYEFFKNRYEEKGIVQLRTIFGEAWDGVKGGDFAKAQEIYGQIEKYHIPGAHGIERLMRGLIDAHCKGDGRTAYEHLSKAFTQARDYSDRAKLITIYLNMLATFQLEDIPPAFHRDAGLAAVALKQHNFALWAFTVAIKAGLEDRLEQVLQSMAAIYRNRLDRGDLAQRIETLRLEIRN